MTTSREVLIGFYEKFKNVSLEKQDLIIQGFMKKFLNINHPQTLYRIIVTDSSIIIRYQYKSLGSSSTEKADALSGTPYSVGEFQFSLNEVQLKEGYATTYHDLKEPITFSKVDSLKMDLSNTDSNPTWGADLCADLERCIESGEKHLSDASKSKSMPNEKNTIYPQIYYKDEIRGSLKKIGNKATELSRYLEEFFKPYIAYIFSDGNRINLGTASHHV